MKRILFIILISCVYIIAEAQQIKEFTPDTILYVQEVKRFTSNYINASETQVVDRFISLWQSGILTWEEMTSIADISTQLIRKNGRASPHFVNFFEIITILYSPEFSEVGKEEWQKGFSFYLSERNTGLRTIELFLKNCVTLLKNNELYNLPGNVWKGINPVYRFEFRNEKTIVSFDPFDLSCYSKRDSITIFQTSGEYDPIDNVWFGRNGTVTWERAGLDRNEVFVKLGKFRVDLRKSEYTADSVLFTYKKYIDFPLEGRLEEKVMFIAEKERAVYPKFFTYQNKYILPDLFRDIEYTGGLSMQGARLLGTGTVFEPCVLNVFDNGMLRMHIESTQFLFSSASVNSPSVKITLYIETDSVFHPDLQFRYNEAADEVRLTKSNTFTSAGPYTNSYHNVDMNFEEFYWKRSERIIKLRPLTGTSIGIATFESNSFFNHRVFEGLQGMDMMNPLVALWQYGRMINTERFPVVNYARYLGRDPSQIRQQLMRLSRMGFVYFDDEADMISIRPKLFYFLDASIGKTDYDVILFTSRTQAPLENAVLDLDNFDLTIYGVQNIFISDSQNVVLFPKENKIVMKRNKSFQFDGVVDAGLFSFFGNNYFFEYDSFKINLQDIDSIGLAVRTGQTDNLGKIVAEKINNLLEDATGELLIDNPLNKSGLKEFPQYPTFISRENSYVYFDENNIQNSVYSRKDINFQVDPFTMDSLDNFTRDGLKLTGTFNSGGIIPPLDQTLLLMPDNSLGFRYRTPEQGMPLYNGKGTIYHDIELTNRGLRAAGKMEYLTSTTWSDDFLFHPDSVMAISRDFSIGKQFAGTEYPGVKSKNNTITWRIKEDEFLAKKQDIPFTIFSDTVKLHGDILLKPSGLSGSGNIDMISASIESNHFVYKADQIIADTAIFKLRSPVLNKLAFSTDNLNSRIDFRNLEGEFRSNTGYTQVEFPENRYISELDFFLWLMDEEQLHMGLDKPIIASTGYDGLEGPRYTSVHPDQDSLSFVSPIAVYEYAKFIIKATEVPYVQVADARIFPADGMVVIEPNARIRKLEEAKIIADFTNEYYKLYEATVNINGKYDYTASAKYNYIDETGREQVIKFASVSVDSSKQSIGTAEITVIDSFSLSPDFAFQGTIRMNSGSRLLNFDGAVRLVHDCNVGRAWLKFRSEIDPLSVLIPVSEAPVDLNLNRIYAGMMLTRDSAHVYSTFASARKDYFDNYLNTASGFLTYDKDNRYYEIAEPEKLFDSTSKGNYLRLHTFPCSTYSEGKLDFLLNYGQLKVDAFGMATHDMEKDAFSADVMLAFDFFFSKEALNVFAMELDSLPELKPYNLSDPVYRLALNELVGSSDAERMANELSLYGTYSEIPDAFKKTIIISNVKLKWNMNTRSFRYNGEVGIVRLGDKQINKQAEVFIELSKRSSGDLLDIYFKLNDRKWYYFGYNPGSLQVTSSNSIFNSILINLKENQRKLNLRGDPIGYIYTLAPERRAQLFIRRYSEEE